MKSKTSKLFMIVFLLGISFFTPIKVVNSCGMGIIEEESYSFLIDDLARKSEFTPYLMQFKDLIDESTTDHVNENISEWATRYCDAASKKDINQFVFKFSISLLESLKRSIKTKSELSPSLKKNSFAVHLKKNKCLEVVNYLIFAKTCEPHVVFDGDYWEKPNRDAKQMMGLIEDGKKRFKQTKSHYVKLRYLYQIVRLAHYAHKYEMVLNLYDELTPQISADPSIVNYWIDGHRAGGMKALGNNIEASYLYAQIFANCKGKRVSAFRSFSIKTDAEWDKCKLLCKNDSEKASLFVLRAAEDNSKALEEMKEIYQLDPKSIHLEQLLISEIYKLESQFLGVDFKQKPGMPKKLSPKADYLIKVQNFVNQVIDERKISDLEMWKLSDAYLEFLSGDFYDAELLIQKYKGDISSPELQDQMDIFELVLKINQLEKIDETVEIDIADIVKNNKSYSKIPSFKTFLFDKLAGIYDKDDRPGKSFRCHFPLSDLELNPKRVIVDDLITIAEKENPNKLEKAFVFQKGVSSKNILYQYKGVELMSAFQFEAALNVLKKVDRNERPTFKVDLFRDRIKDLVHFTSLDTFNYTRIEIIEKIMEYDTKGKVALDEGAPYFYKVGLAYYNLSYYGHGWGVMDYYRSGSNWMYCNDSNACSLYGSPFGNKENKDMSKALEYFEKARLLAKTDEFAAKATYMAAKCRFNEWANDEKTKYSIWGNDIPVLNKYDDYHKLLATKYKSTKYYQMIIKECSHFDVYVRRMN